MKQNLSTLIALALVSGSALAQTAAPAAAEPASTLAYNVGVVSEYRYRGIAQSHFKPALQGGVDYADKSGFYAGAWASTIRWISDNQTADGQGADGPLEVDLYGGYKWSMGDVAFDAGYLRYEYVRNKLSSVPNYGNANTDEIYGAVTYGPFTLKYSYALSNLFGNLNTKGSHYTDLSATFDLGNGLTLTPHAGYQYTKNLPQMSYADYSLTLTKDLGNGLSASLAAINTDAKVEGYYIPLEPTKNTGKSSVVVGLKYTF